MLDPRYRRPDGCPQERRDHGCRDRLSRACRRYPRIRDRRDRRRAPGSGGDISADLVEIARSPVAVVSAGAKAILDLPATLEALETLNVPVVGFGCDEFPAFYSATSGLKLDHRFDEVGVLAKMVDNHLRLARGGLLVCNPPPAEAALGSAEVEDLVARAVADARKAGIVGKAVTPYLLKTINALSGGRTLVCNKALAISNAGLGGRLAAALCA